MKKFRHALSRSVLLPAVLLLAVSLPGCGYHVGSLAHPQLRTIAIADVKNETYEVLAATLLRNVLAERFQFDNSLKLTSLERADCIVYARILKVSNASVSYRNFNKVEDYRPNDYVLTITVEYTVLMPGKPKPLVPKKTTSSTCLYQFTHDPAIGRENALRQCVLRISNAIVSATTESW
ncbi:MAG: hypothetical protein IJS14_14165 [Lentisphaeria bacterium]|nr:hypothetical protein [Lentisphaeria bacterium]